MESRLHTPIYKRQYQTIPTNETSLFNPNQAYEIRDCFIQSSSIKQDEVSLDSTSIKKLSIISDNWSQTTLTR